MRRDGLSYKVPGHVVSEELNGETVVLNLETGNYFALNRTATRMWLLLCDQRTPDEVCREVAQEFGVESERVERDLLTLIASLRERGLLQVE